MHTQMIDAINVICILGNTPWYFAGSSTEKRYTVRLTGYVNSIMPLFSPLVNAISTLPQDTQSRWVTEKLKISTHRPGI